MLFRSPLALLLALPVAAFCAEPADTVNRTPPAVYAERIAPLFTRPDTVATARAALPSDEQDGLVLLSETIHFRDADGILYRAYHHVYHAIGQSAVESLANSIYSYDRERESLFLIEATTVLADGTRLPVETKGAFIQTPQHEAENSLYTSQAELNLIFPQVAPGATTEAIVLIRENTPLMPGEFCAHHVFASGWPIHRRNVVVELPDVDWTRMRTQATADSIAEPRVETPVPGRTRRTWTQSLAPRSRWEESAPSGSYCQPTLWLSTIPDWDHVASWFYGLASSRSELGTELTAEVDRLTAGLADADKIVDTLQSAVSGEVRYTGLEFGLAGYQPYPCAEVWHRRYGDCKDKANLLRAMLAHKGIRAHLVLLNTWPLGRVEKASPTWMQFNHVILAVENGAAGYRFCDPTVKHLPAGTLPFGDLAREVLVIRDGRADWVRTPEDRRAAIRISTDLTLAADGELSGWFTLAAEDSDAAYYTERYNALERQERLRSMQRTVETFVPGAEVADVDYTPLAGSVATFRIRAFLRRAPRSEAGESLTFPFPSDWLPELKTVGERRLPYAALPREESVEARIALPPGWAPAQLPADFEAPSEAAHFSAGWQFADGALVAHLSWSPARQELRPGEYAVFQRSIRALTAWLARPVQLQVGTPASSTAATTTALDHFPILPTGEGQLRLLEEKFSEDGDNTAARRAALERVLQWFPQDTETIFNAQILLARLDRKVDGPKAQADKLAALVARYGAKVPTSLRSWAEYLEIQERWAFNKDKSCIERMRSMAADENLSPFRRGWAAYEASHFLGESNPAAAAKYLAPFCTLECEAQLKTIALVANLRFLAADADGLGKLWREQAAKNGERSDELLNTIVAFVEEDWAKATPAMREKALALFSTTFAKETGKPITAKRVAALKARVATELAQQNLTRGLAAWLKANRPTWWTKRKDTSFADADALIAHIKARNDAKDATGVIDATLQLALHHNAKFPDFVQYLRWSLWWMNNKDRDQLLFDEIVRLSFALPVESSFEVANMWSLAAGHRAAKGDPTGARSLYERILSTPGIEDYQKVEAAGELGHLERKLGNIDAALAAYRRVEPIHSTHRTSADYLYAALFLEVERGNFDRALELVALMSKQEQKYLDETDNSTVINPIVRTGKNPAALKAYWQRTAQWRKSWESFLATAGTQPPAKDLPLGIDWGKNTAHCAKTIVDRDKDAFLQLLASEARIACIAPLVGGNFIAHLANENFLPPALHIQLYECALALVADVPPADPVFDDTAKLWDAALRSGLGRHAEAASTARALFERLGPTQLGQAALRVWLMSAQEPADREKAADEAFTLLASAAPCPERLNTVATLSDLLVSMRDVPRDRALLECETARSDFDRGSNIGRALLSRLAQLESSSAAATALTEYIRQWSSAPSRAWLQNLQPSSLDDPRFAGRKKPMDTSEKGYTAAERLKFNLILALDESVYGDQREEAFLDVLQELATATNNFEDFTALVLEFASNELLSPNIRLRELSYAIWMVTMAHRPDLAKRCAAHPLYANLNENIRTTFDTARKCLATMDSPASDNLAQAFGILTAAPVGHLQVFLGREILEALVFAGNADRAEALVSGADKLAADPTLEMSPSTIRLEWMRTIRHAKELAPFVDLLRRQLPRIPDTDAELSPAAYNTIFPFSRAHLTTPETAALLGHRLRRSQQVVSDLDTFLSMLGDTQHRPSRNPRIGVELFEALVALPLNDKLKSELLGATVGLVDADDPALALIVLNGLDTLSSPTAAKERPQTATVAMRIRARIALRTDSGERPSSLFDTAQTKLIPEKTLAALRLQFHASRGQNAQLESALDALDPALIAEEALFPYIEPALLRQHRDVELGLCKQATVDALRQAVDMLWANPTWVGPRFSIFETVEGDGFNDLVSDAWFDHLAAITRNEMAKARLEYTRAAKHRDWAMLKSAADVLLQLEPSLYDAYYGRAQAKQQLGQTDSARADYDIFLKYCLNSAHYQEALKARRTLDPVASSRN
jgi:hypothetical protein